MKTVKRIGLILFSLLLTGLLVYAGALAEKSLEGDANVDNRGYPSTKPFVHPPFYNAKVLVTLDDKGVILKVEDNGTGLEGSIESKEQEERWEQKNKPFWNVALEAGLLDRFVGKTLDDVKAMRFGAGEADVVSGATACGLAVQEAVINALEGRKGRAFLPGTGTQMPVRSIEGNTIHFDSLLPEDFAVQLLDIRHGIYNDPDSVLADDRYTFTLKGKEAQLVFQDIAQLAPGKYYINMVDQSGTYRPPHFESGHGETDAAQAPCFVLDSGLDASRLSFAEGAISIEGGDLDNYMKNLRHVLIKAEGADDEIEQEPVGHHGTVNSRFNVLSEEGRINPEATFYVRKDRTETPLFEEGKSYQITISAWGYPDLVFIYTR